MISPNKSGGGFRWHANTFAGEDPHDPSQGCLFVASPVAAEKSVQDQTQQKHQLLNFLMPVPLSSATTASETALTSNDGGIKIPVSPGDDAKPPNGVDAKLINGITIPVSSSAGWSRHAPQNKVYPNKYDYEIQISDSNNNDSLEMKVALQYDNPHCHTTNNETMMVNVAIAKTSIHAEEGGKVQLVSTRFQEKSIPHHKTVGAFDSNSQEEWIDITADVDYTSVADDVMDAVLSDPTNGQTAGKVSTTTDQVNVTLGPFSLSGRIIITYKVEKLYTYQAMSTSDTGSDIGTKRICPLFVALPHATLGHEAGMASMSLKVCVPNNGNTELLPLDTHREAYVHLKKQDGFMKSTTVIAIQDLIQHHDGTVGYTFQTKCLPPRSCGVLSWFVMSNQKKDNEVDDFVRVERDLQQLCIGNSGNNNDNNKEFLRAVIQQPSPNDIPSLQVPMPGHGPMGNLVRVKIQTPKAKPRTVPYFILNLTLSDKSGSTFATTGTTTTAMSLSTGEEQGSTTMRQRFNELAIARFLKRLESIPALVQAGVLFLDDIWMDAFLPFDHAAPASDILRVTFRVGDVINSIANNAVATIRDNLNTSKTKNTMNFHQTAPVSSLPFIEEYLNAIGSVVPGGATDFSVGPRTIVDSYKQWEQEAKTLLPTLEENARCTFVEFDTDGGHNRFAGSDYIQELHNLCSVCRVRSGVVTGFGLWLDQDCATRVASALAGGIPVPAQLALRVPQPGAEGLDLMFRRSFAAWISALRQAPPISMKVSAGSVSFPNSLTSTRFVNAMDVLAIRRCTGSTSIATTTMGQSSRRTLPKFGRPEVSNEHFTATVLEDVQAADQFFLYVVSRLESVTQMASALKIVPAPTNERKNDAASPHPVIVSIEEEPSVGDFLCCDWLTMLAATNSPVSGNVGFRSSPLLSRTSLCSRLEDEVSFRFNIPSPSGVTSYLGRCKTVANRAAIDEVHRPQPPLLPIKYNREQRNTINPSSGKPRPRAPIAKGLTSGPFGAPAPSTGVFGSVAAPAVAGFGASSATFGTPAPVTKAPTAGPFGAKAATAGPFGVPAPAPAPSTGLFGSAAAPAVTGFGAGSAPFGPVSSGPFGPSTSPPTAAKGGLFAPAAGGLFGAIQPSKSGPCRGCYHPSSQGAPFSVLGASPSLLAPTPVPFTRDRKLEDDPLWTYAMRIPVGSDEPPTTPELKDALAKVLLACQVVAGDPNIIFYCDICHRTIPNGHDRFHCFDCNGFDMCFSCKDRHQLPLHRVARVSPAANSRNHSCPTTTYEDPLVLSLLQPSTTITQGETAPLLLDDDRWIVVSNLQVRSFLLSVLHWWPLVRSMCLCCDSLPATLPDEIVGKLSACMTSGAIVDLIETTKIVNDSMIREENKVLASRR